MKSFIHSQISILQPLKFGNGVVIKSHNFLGKWLLTHVVIEVNPCLWKGSQDARMTDVSKKHKYFMGQKHGMLNLYNWPIYDWILTEAQ